ncbi:hypothetical protein [Ketobacter alkanivorans]|uniref:Uncharacterized protein n=1 Tax=Ketobacter alkanivorans TaxID=1917421 RepID=A0A2K9LJ69_9GAMM|nr:hypothetical protein [Ketobacter alkanivorans]AUM12290.1 hypothetical protein Kalk_07630 [Ketobacter alkanivorans]
MSRKNGPSLYHMTDKNIFDALQHKKVTLNALNDHLLERGIFLSDETGKSEITEYVASLPHDYHHYQFIAGLIENSNRKEPSTNTVLDVQLKNGDIKSYCDEVVKTRKGSGEVLKISQSGDSTTVTVTYTDVDFSKTEIRQRTTKHAVIEIENNNGALSIRRPANNRAAEIVDQFTNELKKSVKEEVPERIISLEAIVQAEARSYFFDKLIKLIDGFKLVDVKQVNVKFSESDDGEDSDEDDDNGVLLGHIQKAVLNGDGVLQSAEFNQLHGSGFYITKITWVSVDTLPGGDKVEFSAEFGNPDICSDYKYKVCSIYGYKKLDEYNVTGRSPSAIEKKVLLKKLEAASFLAYEKVVNKYGQNDSDEDD